MDKKTLGKSFCLLSLFWLWQTIAPTPCQADITLDGSLGRPGGALQVTPGGVYAIRADMGKQVGTNLFHSFGVFNLNAGQTANFTDGGTTGPVQNILSRVTGGQPSNIDGLLKTSFANDQPNLFFMNPAGVIFGQHASLNVQGSFHVTTADYLKLADGVRFDATPSGNDALLSVSPVTAFGFLSANSKAITVAGGNNHLLGVHEGKSLSLIGGDISIVNSSLFAPSGEINLFSISSAGEIPMYVTGQFVGIDRDAFVQWGKINIKRTSSAARPTYVLDGIHSIGEIDVSGRTRGAIIIRSGEFVLDNSSVWSYNQGNSPRHGIDIGTWGKLELRNGGQIVASTFGVGKGNNVSIDADNVSLTDRGSGIVLETINRSGGDAGNLSLKAKNLEVRKGALIATSTYGSGKGGNLTIKADNLLLSAESCRANCGLFAIAQEGSAGDAGNIKIKAETLTMQPDSVISNATLGSGNGGNLKIKANNIILNDSYITTETSDKATGNAGSLTLMANKLEARNTAQITTGTNGSGKGGNLVIKANSILMSDSNSRYSTGFFTSTQKNSTGSAGNLYVKTGTLIMQKGAKISSSTAGAGESGNLRVEADDSISLTDKDTSIKARADEGSTGSAGKLNIKAKSLNVSNGAFISASTFGSGDGGDLKVKADEVSLNNSRLIATTNQKTMGGKGGSITLNTKTLEVQNGAQILTSSTGSGNAGSINIVNTNNILLSGDGRSARTGLLATTEGRNTGNAGNINIIKAGTLTIQKGAVIRADTVLSEGVGGNIDIEADNIILNKDAQVSAISISPGRSGYISVNAHNSLHVLNNSHISVNTFLADAGDINISVGKLLYVSGGSSINSSVAAGNGNGGNINIDSRFLVLDRASNIIAKAKKGSGGRIDIGADYLFRSPDSIINASSEGGRQGTITIKSPDSNIINSTLKLSDKLLNASSLLSERCATRAYQDKKSSLQVKTRSLRPGPEEWGISRMSTTARSTRKLKLKNANVTTDWPRMTAMNFDCGR